MLDREKLREYGADVETGLMRCMGSEEFYIKMVELIRDEKNFENLNEALDQNDLKRAFEAAHALKGVCGNLALTPLFGPVNEITELLRANTEMDYSEYREKINKAREELERLMD